MDYITLLELEQILKKLRDEYNFSDESYVDLEDIISVRYK